MAEHTPLPWEVVGSGIVAVNETDVDENGNRVYIAMCGNELTPVAGMKYGEERDANAAFIAKACNGYVALVEALKEALPECWDTPKAETIIRAALEAAGEL